MNRAIDQKVTELYLQISDNHSPLWNRLWDILLRPTDNNRPHTKAREEIMVYHDIKAASEPASRKPNKQRQYANQPSLFALDKFDAERYKGTPDLEGGK